MSQVATVSVVIATRNRPQLFDRALQSVLAQQPPPHEVIVVDDGSDERHAEAYASTLAAARSRHAGIQHLKLPRRPRGHGSSYALNTGGQAASGEFLAFLDDDDEWVDPEHLQRVANARGAAERAGRTLDLYLGNQRAWRDGQCLPGPIWLEGLSQAMRARGRQPDDQGCWWPQVADLLQVPGFAHLNTLVVRRTLFDAVEGLDEAIRWENDRDFYMRLLDQAQCIAHHPAEMARHHVPDPRARASITTALSETERRLWQLRALVKTGLFLKNPDLQAWGRRHTAYAWQRLAEQAALRQDWRTAAWLAGQAAGAGSSARWLLRALAWRCRALLSRRG